MAVSVRFSRLALESLKDIRVFDRGRIVQAVEEQLTHEPTVQTRNRKLLPDLVPSFPCEPPIWELRVGDFRVFYDVDQDVVHIRAVLPKRPHQATEQVL